MNLPVMLYWQTELVWAKLHGELLLQHTDITLFMEKQKLANVSLNRKRKAHGFHMHRQWHFSYIWHLTFCNPLTHPSTFPYRNSTYGHVDGYSIQWKFIYLLIKFICWWSHGFSGLSYKVDAKVSFTKQKNWGLIRWRSWES